MEFDGEWALPTPPHLFPSNCSLNVHLQSHKETMSTMVDELRQIDGVSLQGEPPQRIAAYQGSQFTTLIQSLAKQSGNKPLPRIRIERYEVAGKWGARMMMAGFTSRPISVRVSNAIRQLITRYCERNKVKEEMGALCFGWEEKNLIVASAWS